MTYLKLFKRVKKDKGLNTKQTVELFSEILGRSVRTVENYSNKGCPDNSLKLLRLAFKKVTP